MRLKHRINKFLAERFNFGIVIEFPRHATRFAINYFKHKEIVVVEIGTYQGFHAENLLKKLNIKKLYIIDPYEEYKDYLDSEALQTQSRLSSVEIQAKNRLEKYSDKIVWLKSLSTEAIKSIREKVDMVYIDANHEYEYVKEDLKNYYKILKDGGIMSGHDIAACPGVGKALIEFCYGREINPIITRNDFFFVKKVKDVSTRSKDD